MPRSQVLAIANTQADLTVHHNPGKRLPHSDMPDWPDFSRQQMITHIHRHRPCTVTYVGEYWQMCIQNRPLGIRWMKQLRPWVNIRVMPSLCRFIVDASVEPDPTDRTMQSGDLGPGWRAVSDDLYEMC